MHRLLSLVLFSALTSSTLFAQQLPLFTQYVYDPYLINPSMVGTGNRPEVNVLYRRQWTSNPDGPKTMQFDAQLPLKGRMSLGANIYNDKSILLSATSAVLTYGYRVPLASNQTLGFGLSAGVFQNRIDLSEVATVDSKDPALLSASTNNMALNGAFGVHYRINGLVLGFSLPMLFERTTFTPETFQPIKLGGLQNQIYYASYRFAISPDTWFLQPNVQYRMTPDNQNFYEASALISYRGKVDVGGGYRENFGPSAMLRLTWKRLSVGAAYDFPSTRAQVSTGGTQEFQLKWRFGPDDEPAPKKSTTKPQNEEAQVQPTKPKEEEKPAEVIKEDVKPAVVAPIVVEKQPEVVTKPVEQPVEEVKPVPVEDFYFVIGTFESRENAQQFYNIVRKKGIAAEIRESKAGETPHYFYVHIPQYKTKEVTLDRILELQKQTGFRDAWFKKLD